VPSLRQPRATPITVPLTLLLLACTETDAPTWHGDVAPILAERCVTCHQSDAIGPLPLDGYARVHALSDEVVAAPLDRRMPPYGVDASGQCGTFVDPAGLSETELDTLANWLAADAPEGEGTGFPTVPQLPQLARIERTVDLGVDPRRRPPPTSTAASGWTRNSTRACS